MGSRYCQLLLYGLGVQEVHEVRGREGQRQLRRRHPVLLLLLVAAFQDGRLDVAHVVRLLEPGAIPSLVSLKVGQRLELDAAAVANEVVGRDSGQDQGRRRLLEQILRLDKLQLFQDGLAAVRRYQAAWVRGRLVVTLWWVQRGWGGSGVGVALTLDPWSSRGHWLLVFVAGNLDSG